MYREPRARPGRSCAHGPPGEFESVRRCPKRGARSRRLGEPRAGMSLHTLCRFRPPAPTDPAAESRFPLARMGAISPGDRTEAVVRSPRAGPTLELGRGLVWLAPGPI
eukprot:scaffold7243_cov394-Prasinococcus_capsulatus_cf.AAC.23